MIIETVGRTIHPLPTRWKHMNTPIVENAKVHPPSPARRSLRLRVKAGAWHLSEIGADNVGGIFSSLSSAMAYARDELRGARGGRVGVEFEGGAGDRRP
jgi:hypothetical protein